MEFAISEEMSSRFARFAAAVSFFSLGLLGAIHPRAEADLSFNPRTFCSQSTENVNACLKTALRYRCANYGEFFTRNTLRTKECVDGVDRMISLLDITQAPIESAPAAPHDPVKRTGLILRQLLFTRTTDRVFSEKRTGLSFSAALDGLRDAARFERETNLWESVYQANGRNRAASIRFMAVALQDMSSEISHINYLLEKYGKQGLSPDSVPATNVLGAREFVRFLNLSLENRVAIRAYPDLRGIERDLDPLFHHFYLPAYIAIQLKKSGVKDETAFFSAFLLNTGYEFVKLEAKASQDRWPFRDPKPFPAARNSLQLRKIYTGYVGALWGLGREHEAKSFEVFQREMAADPFGSMRGYFSILFDRGE